MTQFLSKNWKYFAVGLVAVVIAAAAIVKHVALKNQLESWKVLPEPERLTELYFTNSQNLPKTYVPGQALPADFTVHNLEGRTTPYHYAIIEQNQAGSISQTLSTGNFNLASDQSKAVRAAIMPIDLGTRAKFTINLTTNNLSIAYWLTKGA